MQPQAQQQSFFNLFDLAPEPTASRPAEEKPKTTDFEFVSPRQREIMQTSPFASFVRGKTLDEINAVDGDFGNKLYKKSNTADGSRRYALWRDTVSSAQTIALEIEYRKVDERFTKPEKGIFYLVDNKDKRQAINYDYKPFYFGASNGNRVSMSVHHIEFRSPNPNEISETGYRSHFFPFIPFSFVKNFADFMVQLLRIQMKITSTIVFDGEEFEFDASLLPAPKPKTKTKKCPECDTKIRINEIECPNCGYYENEDDDEIEDDFDEDFDEDFEVFEDD